MSIKHNTSLFRTYNSLFRKPCDINKEQEWLILQKEIILILNSRKSTKSLEELYRIVENLHTLKYELLFCNLQKVVEQYLEEELKIFNQSNNNILIVLDKLWKEFCRNIRTIKNIFLPVSQLNKKVTYNIIHNMSLSAFTRIIVTNLKIKSKILDDLLDLIHQERVNNDNENITNKILIKSIIEIFNSLQIYEIFENLFLRNTQQFYENEAKEMLIASDLSVYLKHTNRRIVEESNRTENYLNHTTEKPLLDIMYYEFIGNHLTIILDKGFYELINRNMFEELSLAYKLFQRNQKNFKHLINDFSNMIVKKGIHLVESSDDKSLIENLLNFKQQLEVIIERSFNQNVEFHNSIRLMFKKLINPNNNNKIAQLLAKYLDRKMCSKNITDDDFDMIINKVLQLFKYLHYKDIFEEFYKRYLAKRLLFNKSTNIDAENSLIMKLKLECGDNFTINIENMLQDINVSRTINLRYKEKQIDNHFFINILTNSYWPDYPNYKINIPVELINYQQSFEQFYRNYHNGRKLLWQSTLSFCIIRTKLNQTQKELQTSLYQTIVLLLFNNNDSLSLNDIYELTGLEPTELERTLLSLKQNQILIRSNNSFSVNLNYTNRLYRVRMNSVQLNETFQQKLEIEQKVTVDRQYQIDAAIVRIMKNYKTIQHNLLMNELYKILEIPIKQSDIKKRIELLIEREYMERDKDNRACYIYIA